MWGRAAPAGASLGKEVPDFEEIKYDHLFTLNVAATQELAVALKHWERRWRPPGRIPHPSGSKCCAGRQKKRVQRSARPTGQKYGIARKQGGAAPELTLAILNLLFFQFFQASSLR